MGNYFMRYLNSNYRKSKTLPSTLYPSACPVGNNRPSPAPFAQPLASGQTRPMVSQVSKLHKKGANRKLACLKLRPMKLKELCILRPHNNGILGYEEPQLQTVLTLIDDRLDEAQIQMIK